MTIKFHKFEGTGNDFIIIDTRKVTKKISSSQIKKLCNRKFGIGADGLILCEKSKTEDFSMQYYNADGYEGSLCGNGGRCILALANYFDNNKTKFSFEAIDGIHEGHICKSISRNQWIVKLKMNNVSEIIKHKDSYEINTGSPHYIKFVKKINTMNVLSEGKKIRYNKIYKNKGINVNFVEIKNDNLFVRTYERGVENETLSCGTGVVASTLAYATEEKIKAGIINIQTLGGNLEVSFIKNNNIFNEIWLKGQVTFVYHGEINI